MYSRVYPQNEGLPPNYKGNAFDKACAPPPCRENHEGEPPCGENESPKQGLLSILTRRDGKKFELDDLILGGLIILLLNNHADDELLLILMLLFITGL